MRLVTRARELIVVDILEENIEKCRGRLASYPDVEFYCNDGTSLEPILDESVSLIYCFDAMVHFDSDVVRSYMREFERVLRPGGHAFCHHSNYSDRPTGDFRQSPGARNFMSRELFEHYAHKERLRVVKAKPIHWEHQDSDCLTLLEKPEVSENYADTI